MELYEVGEHRSPSEKFQGDAHSASTFSPSDQKSGDESNEANIEWDHRAMWEGEEGKMARTPEDYYSYWYQESNQEEEFGCAAEAYWHSLMEGEVPSYTVNADVLSSDLLEPTNSDTASDHLAALNSHENDRLTNLSEEDHSAGNPAGFNGIPHSGFHGDGAPEAHGLHNPPLGLHPMHNFHGSHGELNAMGAPAAYPNHDPIHGTLPRNATDIYGNPLNRADIEGSVGKNFAARRHPMQGSPLNQHVPDPYTMAANAAATATNVVNAAPAMYHDGHYPWFAPYGPPIPPYDPSYLRHQHQLGFPPHAVMPATVPPHAGMPGMSGRPMPGMPGQHAGAHTGMPPHAVPLASSPFCAAEDPLLPPGATREGVTAVLLEKAAQERAAYNMYHPHMYMQEATAGKGPLSPLLDIARFGVKGKGFYGKGPDAGGKGAAHVMGDSVATSGQQDAKNANAGTVPTIDENASIEDKTPKAAEELPKINLDLAVSPPNNIPLPSPIEHNNRSNFPLILSPETQLPVRPISISEGLVLSNNSGLKDDEWKRSPASDKEEAQSSPHEEAHSGAIAEVLGNSVGLSSSGVNAGFANSKPTEIRSNSKSSNGSKGALSKTAKNNVDDEIAYQQFQSAIEHYYTGKERGKKGKKGDHLKGDQSKGKGNFYKKGNDGHSYGNDGPSSYNDAYAYTNEGFSYTDGFAHGESYAGKFVSIASEEHSVESVQHHPLHSTDAAAEDEGEATWDIDGVTAKDDWNTELHSSNRGSHNGPISIQGAGSIHGSNNGSFMGHSTSNQASPLDENRTFHWTDYYTSTPRGNTVCGTKTGKKGKDALGRKGKDTTYYAATMWKGNAPNAAHAGAANAAYHDSYSYDPSLAGVQSSVGPSSVGAEQVVKGKKAQFLKGKSGKKGRLTEEDYKYAANMAAQMLAWQQPYFSKATAPTGYEQWHANITGVNTKGTTNGLHVTGKYNAAESAYFGAQESAYFAGVTAGGQEKGYPHTKESVKVGKKGKVGGKKVKTVIVKGTKKKGKMVKKGGDEKGVSAHIDESVASDEYGTVGGENGTTSESKDYAYNYPVDSNVDSNAIDTNASPQNPDAENKIVILSANETAQGDYESYAFGTEEAVYHEYEEKEYSAEEEVYPVYEEKDEYTDSYQYNEEYDAKKELSYEEKPPEILQRKSITIADVIEASDKAEDLRKDQPERRENDQNVDDVDMGVDYKAVDAIVQTAHVNKTKTKEKFSDSGYRSSYLENLLREYSAETYENSDYYDKKYAEQYSKHDGYQPEKVESNESPQRTDTSVRIQNNESDSDTTYEKHDWYDNHDSYDKDGHDRSLNKQGFQKSTSEKAQKAAKKKQNTYAYFNAKYDKTGKDEKQGRGGSQSARDSYATGMAHLNGHSGYGNLYAYHATYEKNSHTTYEKNAYTSYDKSFVKTSSQWIDNWYWGESREANDWQYIPYVPPTKGDKAKGSKKNEYDSKKGSKASKKSYVGKKRSADKYKEESHEV